MNFTARHAVVMACENSDEYVENTMETAPWTMICWGTGKPNT